MKESKINQAGTRKAYSCRGEKTQKMMSFRLDIENYEYLSTKPNKGRFINDLIERARMAEQESEGGN